MKTKTYILSIALVIVYQFANAQLPSAQLKNSGKSLVEIVPTNWEIMDTAFGDIDRDGIGDMAFVVRDTDPREIVDNKDMGASPMDYNPRVLGIYFGDASGIYHQNLVSDSFIIMRESPAMDEPFTGISISEEGILSIDFYFFYSAGSWEVNAAEYKFRYENGQYALIGLERTSANRATADVTRTSVNFLTQNIQTTSESPDIVDPLEEWSSFEIDSPYTLRTIGRPFEIMFEGMFML